MQSPAQTSTNPGVIDLREAHPQQAGEADTTAAVQLSVDSRPVRIGLAALLFVNALVALLEPDSFRTLLEGVPFAEQLPAAIINVAILAAAVNDFLLGLAMLLSKRRALVYQWLAAWFAIIAVTKVLDLIF